jgi:uncharacterized protein YbgA (DUF1722 family)
MPTPPKPFTVLTSEKKSHRTRSELNRRKQGEEALSTGVALKERSEIKSNPVAHKEFKRINTLLGSIGKNDAIYEIIINRYCLMVAECTDLQNKRENCYQIMLKLDESFDEELDNTPSEERAKLIRSYAKTHSDLLNSLLCCDSQIQAKRKMLLDIEKENIMTIAAALRSIPKKQENKTNALFEALGGD